MNSRLKLHSVLLNYLPNVYYQPPSNIKMNYPCIIYSKSGKIRNYADDIIYRNRQQYSITVIEVDPDSEVADRMELEIPSCVISQYYTVDNLNHTTLNLTY